MFTIAIIGLGGRGNNYANIVKHFCSSDAKIIALCDCSEPRLKECQTRFSVDAAQCFTDENEFFKQKRADAIFICTQDRDHYGHVMKAAALNYDIMCEKPLSPSIKECEAMRDEVNKRGLKMLVCHVLRYSAYYIRIKSLIESGAIGELVSIDHTENVGYFHFAHSYVRGNWRDANTTTPMIMAKTCHDFDLIHWFMDGGCERISSFGSLKHFKAENAPAGSTARCLDGCAYKAKCPFDAERLYITTPLRKATFLRFLGRTITGKDRPSKAEKYQALREGIYGRCVYRSDNNVVDHQMVNMDFTGGRTASLTVTAFSKLCYRHTHIMGTLGEIRGNDEDGILHVREFFGKSRKIHTKFLPLPGHLGGDIGIVKDFVALMNGAPTKQRDLTLVDVTVFSHKMAMAAEYSRLHNGEKVELEGFKG